MTNIRNAAIHGGFGAGVGASLAMMLVMAVLRFTSNTASIPELMENTLVQLTGGETNSFFINNLGVGGKALLIVCIVWGTMLLGGLLGLGFTHLWLKLAGSSMSRYLSGLLYGLAVGVFLNLVFLPLFAQGFFGLDSRALQVTAPPEVSQALYQDALAPVGLPTWLNMFVLSIIFGLALAYLLPKSAMLAVGGESGLESANAPVSRRGFSKVLGGTVLALFGGGVLWVAVRQALSPPVVAGLQEFDLRDIAQQAAQTRTAELGAPTAGATAATTATAAPPTETQGTKATATQQPENTPTQGPSESPTAVADSNHDVIDKPTPQPTEVPADASVPPGFEGVKAQLVPAITPNESFYITTKNFIDPTVDAGNWTLTFKGMVDNPYSITFEELKAMPAFDRVETLACISNPVGGDLIGNANWKGVDFAELVRRAGPQQGVVDVICHAADGYADSFPLDVALNNECVLVYEMNGEPLTNKHGYPARLLVPNIYGMKNVKWITEVELANYDFKGYWESQGWDDVAIYNTFTRIDFPNKGNIEAKPLYVTGVSFAGNRGIKMVEVSTDGGKTWNEAQIQISPGEFAWVLWTYPWNPQPGAYTLQARATDGDGIVQTAKKAATYPSGATGYHTRTVRVG